jgi:transcriptional regulator with XRE-family HTH domain
MPETPPDRFFVRLRTEREHQDLTVQWIADKVGVTKSSVSEWETGKSRPGLPAVRKWVKALGLDESVVEDWIEEQAIQRVKAILTDKGRVGHEVRDSDVEALLTVVRNTLRANR